MKIFLMMAAVFAACSSSAHAQTQVELYGIVDIGLNWNSNAAGTGRADMSSGVASGSRLGLRGSEKFGDGWSAVFLLENGFDLDTGNQGQGGRLFGRQSYLGLASERYGSITLGRQYDSGVDVLARYHFFAQMGGYLTAHPGDVDNFNNARRVNQALKYTSPVWQGVTLTSLYSANDSGDGADSRHIWSAGANYTAGGFGVSAAYLNVRSPNTAFFSDSSASPLTTNINGPVLSGLASASRYEVIGLGGQYKAGGATVGMIYSHVSFTGLGNLRAGPNPQGYQGAARFDTVEGNVTYRIAPTVLLGVAYTQTLGNSLNGTRPAQYRQTSAGIDYFLSARTDFYLVGTYQKASGTDSTGRAAVASINGPIAASRTDTQAVVRVGMRHKF